MSRFLTTLRPAALAKRYEGIIFDKDGTLLDFAATAHDARGQRLVAPSTHTLRRTLPPRPPCQWCARSRGIAGILFQQAGSFLGSSCVACLFFCIQACGVNFDWCYSGVFVLV